MQSDAFSVFFHLVIGGIVLVTLLISLDYFEGHTSYVGEFYALILFGATGMMLMTSSVELLMVFISLEISSISTYILAGYRKRSATSPEASIKYFLLGSFATAFFLYGIALCFGATGSTNIYEIAKGVAGGASPLLLTVAFGMMLIGLGFKVSLAPFHVWTPDVYEGAPAPVVGLMSTAPKAAAFAVLLRITYGAYGTVTHIWMPLIWILAVLSMTIGNLGALTQRNVKRMLAYSSIAHAGYLLVAFTALAPMGIASASFYTAAYAAMNVGAFGIISYLSGFNEARTNLSDYAGVARRHPVAAAAFAVFLISLIGIPFTAGFFGKFYVFTAARQFRQRMAGCPGPAEQRRGCVLLSAPAGPDVYGAGRTEPASRTRRMRGQHLYWEWRSWCWRCLCWESSPAARCDWLAPVPQRLLRNRPLSALHLACSDAVNVAVVRNRISLPKSAANTNGLPGRRLFALNLNLLTLP